MLKSSKRLCSIILAVVLLFSTTPAAFAAKKSASHDLSNGALTLTAKKGDIRVYGSYDGYGAGIIVKDGYNGTITLDNVSIYAKKDQEEINRRMADYEQNSKNNPNYPLEVYSLWSGINIDTDTNVIINFIGNNKITGDKVFGIYATTRNDLLLTGEGTLEIDTPSECINFTSGYSYTHKRESALFLDVESVFNGSLELPHTTINKKTIINNLYSGITSANLTINAETIITSSNKSSYGVWTKNLTINAKTTVDGGVDAAILGENITINAPTYAKGNNGILINTYAAGFGGLIVKADTTAIGTKGYGVYSPTNITVDDCTLTATGSKKGVQIGQGQKNVIKGNGKIDAKTSK